MKAIEFVGSIKDGTVYKFLEKYSLETYGKHLHEMALNSDIEIPNKIIDYDSIGCMEELFETVDLIAKESEVTDMKSVMKVYKKVRVLKDGKCYPLFIDKTKPFEFGEWMHAEFHPTKGFAPRSLNGVDSENPIGGWHACFTPLAPHIADELKTGEKRVWMECDAAGEIKKYDRPESQGGAWVLVEWLRPLRLLTENEIRELTLGKTV